jgi:hypothetical protein
MRSVWQKKNPYEFIMCLYLISTELIVSNALVYLHGYGITHSMCNVQ